MQEDSRDLTQLQRLPLTSPTSVPFAQATDLLNFIFRWDQFCGAETKELPACFLLECIDEM